MSESHADFAVFGSTPLARLLAGFLAQQHGKSVVIVGDSRSTFRLPRATDLSFGAITRPETWALLADTLPETSKLLARIGGKACLRRIDPILFADTAAGSQGLAYIRHMASGFGHAVERLPPGALGPDREGIVARDALQLHGPQLEPVLNRWLDQLKIPRYLTPDISAAMQPGGGARITAGSDVIDVAIPVLADDAAIMAHLPATAIDPLFEIQTHATILTEPTMALAAPVMLQIDSGLVLTQSASRSIRATGPGTLENLALRLGVLLATQQHPRRAGQSTYQVQVSRDRAPVLGRLDERGPMTLANFGSIGAFLAPAIARILAGNGRPDEVAYFTAHAPTRILTPSIVADYGPPLQATGAPA